MKKILFITLLSILIVIPATLSAQYKASKKTVAGTWEGKLSAGGMVLRIVFHVKLTGDNLTATMDSPDQGAAGVALGKVTLDAQKLIIQAPSMSGEYSGTITDDLTMNGTWTQNGDSFPLNLKKQPAAK
jgi:uncharacterized protein